AAPGPRRCIRRSTPNSRPDARRSGMRVLGEGEEHRSALACCRIIPYLARMTVKRTTYMVPSPGGALELAPDCLMFAIDDTGHERLKGQSTYGLGGCAVMGRDYYRCLADPWRRRRAATTGSFGGRLHASEFGRRATRANIAAMGRFFADQPFFRFAAVATVNTEYPRNQELMAWVMVVLKVRIAE